MEQNKNNTVTIENESLESSVMLVGTIHISRSSRNRVIETITENEPDAVTVELDKQRYNKMTENLSTNVVNKEKSGLRDYIPISPQDVLYSNIDGDDIVQQGRADMMPAIEQARQIQADIAFVDKPINETIKLFVNEMKQKDGLYDLEVFNQDIEDIASYIRKRLNTMGNDVEELISELEQKDASEIGTKNPILPELTKYLIEERDKNMAGQIYWMQKNGYTNILSVMGKGHLQGVKHYLENPSELDEEYVTEPEWHEYTYLEI